MTPDTEATAPEDTTAAAAVTAARPEAAVPALPDLTSPRAMLLLAIADDALITGHRASHWTGVAPSLEEDLAFSTIAQDGINQADLWYQMLLGPEVTGTELRAGVDALGLGRPADAYRHAIVCERPPGDYAYTLARHWITTRVVVARIDALRDAADTEVAAIATKLAHELRYHTRHAEHWFDRLAGGGDDAHTRLGDALAAVLPEALGLFEPAPGEVDDAEAAALLPGGHLGLRERVVPDAASTLAASGYGSLTSLLDGEVPDGAAGGRTGRHTPDFTDDVWPEMTALHRAHPGASW